MENATWFDQRPTHRPIDPLIVRLEDEWHKKLDELTEAIDAYDGCPSSGNLTRMHAAERAEFDAWSALTKARADALNNPNAALDEEAADCAATIDSLRPGM